ncbi:chorismate-binding protein [Chryseobacterium gwangjuense]|uniref:chorismate-binding protein n=1 Tax=Chryseobacterium gwangjuense TaxID=1069980 RepID=UPI001E3AA6FE|nr:chorismate-binding protein [Chryseobacterium gwangjuense]MCE3076409.1 chorismate-binding protein [Chryseobacterium gwangjuense]
MIYFKFPFDERLYSTDENSGENNINFYSFDGLSQIDFNGKIIEIDPEKFNPVTISSQSLAEDKNGFITETKEEYLNTLCKVIEVIKNNQLPKLVYSRRKIFTDFNQIDLKESFKSLCNSYPNAFRYIFVDNENSWMGAFSEVLGKFNKKTHTFETMSLAGTLPVSEHWSEKEIEEQKPVSSYIRNILKNYSETLDESESYDHISGNIKHLRTDFKIKIQPEDLDQIIKELHPTPAVCGIPKAFCKENIQQLEKFPRELYAGYIKIETEESIQYFVNLRCSKLYKNAVHLFVGGGITAQSSPEKEWIETELKSEAVLKNLVVS